MTESNVKPIFLPNDENSFNEVEDMLERYDTNDKH